MDSVVLSNFLIILGDILIVRDNFSPGLLNPLEGAKFVSQVIKHFYRGAGRGVGGAWGFPIRQGPSD